MLTLPSPKFPDFSDFPLLSLQLDVEKLLSSGEFSGLQISIGESILLLHKCLLSSWDYSKILFRSQTEIPTIAYADAVYISAFANYYLLTNTRLFKHCSKKASQIDSSNWFEAYMLGNELGDEELKDVAGKMASPHSVHMLEGMLERILEFWLNKMAPLWESVGC
jgi:hypothetical protein